MCNVLYQVPYHVLSGQTPRKVEMERRRRDYARQEITELIEEQGEESRRLVPNATASSKPKPGSWNFPSFLPLECFDNESFDPRTPEEWMGLGLENLRNGDSVRKPIPGRALLPDLDPRPVPSRPVSTTQDDYESRPGSSRFVLLVTNNYFQTLSFINRSLRSGARTPLDPIPLSQSSSRHSLMSSLPVIEGYSKPLEVEGPPYYEWAEVGVLDYCPVTKRYLVKRAVVPQSMVEENEVDVVTEEGEKEQSSSGSDTNTLKQESSNKETLTNGEVTDNTDTNGSSVELPGIG